MCVCVCVCTLLDVPLNGILKSYSYSGELGSVKSPLVSITPRSSLNWSKIFIRLPTKSDLCSRHK